LIMLRSDDYSQLIEKVNAGKNINLWGKKGVGKTFTVKNYLLRDVKLDSVYLNLEYPFSLNHLFQVLPISFGLYYQQDWQNIVAQLATNSKKLLVIDNFDRMHCVSETFGDDLFRLQQLSQLKNLSLLLVSRMELKHFHFSNFAGCFEELEANKANTW
jgi:AAA domain